VTDLNTEPAPSELRPALPATADGTRARHVEPRDADWLAGLPYEWHCTYRWSPRGRTPSPESVGALMWRGVAAQYVVHDVNQPLAVVQVHDLDLKSGFAYASLIANPHPAGPAVVEVVAALIRATFAQHPLRKIYVEVLAHEVDGTVGALLPRAALVATLHDHDRQGPGTYADLAVYQIEPEADSGGPGTTG
jgi:hypothetical protein